MMIAAAPSGGGSLGWPKVPKIIKKAAGGVVKATKTAAKGVTTVTKATGINTLVSTAAKAAIAAHKLPLTLMLKAAEAATKVVCASPLQLQQVAALSARVPTNTGPVFCAAIRAKSFSQVRSLLPSAIKLTAGLAATAAVPGAGPALLAINAITSTAGKVQAAAAAPGQYATQFVADKAQAAYGPYQAEAQAAYGPYQAGYRPHPMFAPTQPLSGAFEGDYLDAALGSALAGISDEDLAEAVFGEGVSQKGAVVIGALAGLMIYTGVVFGLRRRL